MTQTEVRITNRSKISAKLLINKTNVCTIDRTSNSKLSQSFACLPSFGSIRGIENTLHKTSKEIKKNKTKNNSKILKFKT